MPFDFKTDASFSNSFFNISPGLAVTGSADRGSVMDGTVSDSCKVFSSVVGGSRVRLFELLSLSAYGGLDTAASGPCFSLFC